MHVCAQYGGQAQRAVLGSGQQVVGDMSAKLFSSSSRNLTHSTMDAEEALQVPNPFLIPSLSLPHPVPIPSPSLDGPYHLPIPFLFLYYPFLTLI